MTSTDFDPATAVLDDIAGDYTLDPAHSRLGFSARHAMVATVRGQFTEFTGTAHVDTANPADSKVEVSIVANSISTGNEQRDGHLLSGGLLRDRAVPQHHLHLDRRLPRRRRLDDHRRPDHQGRHQAHLGPLRVHRLGPGPVRQHPHRLRGCDHPAPQGLGADLERRARDRRRPRLRQDQAPVRHLGDQERLTRTVTPRDGAVR